MVLPAPLKDSRSGLPLPMSERETERPLDERPFFQVDAAFIEAALMAGM